MGEEGTENDALYEHIEFALEATDSVIWAVDLATGDTTTLYGAVESLFNIETKDVESAESFFKNVVHPEDLPEVEQVYVEVMHGETNRFKAEFRTHPDNGEVQWIEAHARVQTVEEERLLTGISTNITDRKRHERELEQKNEQFEELISVISHDLRNPLNVAQGRTQLAQQEGEWDYLNSVARAHERMEELIENLLTSVEKGTPLTRGGQTTKETDAIELTTLVETCWQNVETNESILVTESDLVVYADRSRLQQLFENLFRNAVEHGGPDVTVTIGDIDDESGFYVSDDGPGVPESERERIFERGYSTSEEGVGLGLHIVQEIVNIYGWEIAVTDSKSGGARFEVTGITTD